MVHTHRSESASSLPTLRLPSSCPPGLCHRLLSPWCSSWHGMIPPKQQYKGNISFPSCFCQVCCHHGTKVTGTRVCFISIEGHYHFLMCREMHASLWRSNELRGIHWKMPPQHASSPHILLPEIRLLGPHFNQ